MAIVGQVFLDLDGDGEFDETAVDGEADRPIQGVTVQLETWDGAFTVSTGADGFGRPRFCLARWW